MIIIHENIHIPMYVLAHIEALLTYREERMNLSEKRRDGKDRLLRMGESQRPSGSHTCIVIQIGTETDKRAQNFYQDKKYLVHINLSEVENKYSFTDADDLEWMDMPYEQPEDVDVLKEYYTDYCTKRF